MNNQAVVFIFNVSSTTKIKVLVKLFQKLADSKGRAFGRSNERNGGAGAAAPALNVVPKKFGRLKAAQPFFIKRLPKNFFETIEGRGQAPTPPFRCKQRPKALPLESASF